MLRTLSTACVHIDNMISGAISQTREEKKFFFYNFSEFQNLGAHISQNIYILEKSSTYLRETSQHRFSRVADKPGYFETTDTYFFYRRDWKRR